MADMFQKQQPRDHKHMSRVLDSLMVAWKMNPYLRFGQLLMNAGMELVDTYDGAPDLFYIEDEVLAQGVIRFSEAHHT